MSNPSPAGITDEQRLTWVAAKVQEWCALREEVPPTMPGSSLAADNATFPTLPISHLVWHGISHAIDHLDLFMYPLTQTGTGFPLAPQTLARSSVLGAAHALWIVDGPNRLERQRRGLHLAHTEFSSERTALREVAGLPDAPAGLDAAVAVRTKWIDRVIAAGVAAGIPAGQMTQPINDTAIIDSVAKRYVQVADPQNASLVATYRILWRTQSATAHGYRWPAMMRAEIMDKRPDGGSNGRIKGEVEALALSATAAALLIQRAIDIFERRRRHHADN